MKLTLDLYVPDSSKTTGAGVLLCPGGGYSMLTVPGEGATIAEFFKSHSSRTNLTQDDTNLYEPLSPWKHVTRDTPSAFIVHGTYDFLVPVKNSLLYYEACLKARVPIEMHLEDIAQHGFGMAVNLNDETVKEWPEQVLSFIMRHGWISAE